jgi:hypothetical protein
MKIAIFKKKKKILCVIVHITLLAIKIWKLKMLLLLAKNDNFNYPENPRSSKATSTVAGRKIKKIMLKN